jgi:hypothetical protein
VTTPHPLAISVSLQPNSGLLHSFYIYIINIQQKNMNRKARAYIEFCLNKINKKQDLMISALIKGTDRAAQNCQSDRRLNASLFQYNSNGYGHDEPSLLFFSPERL